ncbi:uncharacterized protein LOC125501111 [Athalia rosae]|uniref:uncharacterized protein LOC125501111 n=1 Tax=Athalia rosae TaxID=37344 RepID=UPI002034690D|nr:uncharacterized protein LOC125501111 [Athalia rosae]
MQLNDFASIQSQEQFNPEFVVHSKPFIDWTTRKLHSSEAILFRHCTRRFKKKTPRIAGRMPRSRQQAIEQMQLGSCQPSKNKKRPLPSKAFELGHKFSRSWKADKSCSGKGREEKTRQTVVEDGENVIYGDTSRCI